jgi:hypothetical protein
MESVAEKLIGRLDQRNYGRAEVQTSKAVNRQVWELTARQIAESVLNPLWDRTWDYLNKQIYQARS